MKTVVVLAALAALPLLSIACSKPAPETNESSSTSESKDKAPSAPSVSVSGSAFTFTIPAPSAPPASSSPASAGKDVTWSAPAKWATMPNASAMRKATYKIPRAGDDKEDGEISVIAASGGVDANVQRWAGQFGGAKPKTETRTPNGLKVTIVEMHGTYAGGMPGMGGSGAPKDHYMLLGAIVDQGDTQWFFKGTGPEKTMTAAKPDFDAFVASFK
jgi:hypothetical protein